MMPSGDGATGALDCSATRFPPTSSCTNLPTPNLNLLAYKVNQLGDNLAFVAVVQQWRRLFPDGQVTLFTSPGSAALYGGPLAPDRMVVVNRDDFNSSWRNPAGFWRHWATARAARADAALVGFDQGSAAHFLARLSGAPIRLGSANLRITGPDGLTHRVAYQAGTSIAEWNWSMGRELCRLCQRDDWPERPRAPELGHLVGAATVRRPGSVALHAGSSLAFRRWPVARFAELAGRLARDFEVTWIDAAELGATPDIPGVRRASCKDIGELAGLLARTDCFVGNHSGPLQLAAALGGRGVVISGPTNPQWDPPGTGQNWCVLRCAGLKCLPCESLRHSPGRCLNPQSPHACTDYWTVEAVEQKCRALLAQPASAPPP